LRKVVAVALGGGRFEIRQLELGAYAGGYYEVLAGLNVGDTVVTSGQFLIDSDANLKSAGTAMAGMNTGQGEAERGRQGEMGTRGQGEMENMRGTHLNDRKSEVGEKTDMPGMDMHGKGMNHPTPNSEPRTKYNSTKQTDMPGMNMSHDSTGQEH